MQKHIVTIKTAAGRHVFVYQLAIPGSETCYVLARTPARVTIRNAAIYPQYGSLEQATRIARTLY